MDEVPSSKHSPDEVSASKRSLVHEDVVVAEDHVENKGADDLNAKDVVAEVHAENKGADDSNDRVAALAKVETEKGLKLIKAWEESEKTKAENKAYKKLSAVGAWENTKRALVEVQLKQIEEEHEKKKADEVEKIRNKIAMLHKKAEEKRAAVEAKRGEEFLKIDEKCAELRKDGTKLRKIWGCFRV